MNEDYKKIRFNIENFKYILMNLLLVINLEEMKPLKILAISWDYHAIWSIMALLVKHARRGDQITIAIGNTGTNGFKKIVEESFGIKDVRAFGAVPFSWFMSHAEEVMVKVTNIVRDVKPDIVLLQDPEGWSFGWYALFCSLMDRAVHEASMRWAPRGGVPAERIHTPRAIYYWWTNNPTILIDVSDVVKDVEDARLRFHLLIYKKKGAYSIRSHIALRRARIRTKEYLEV